jgi:predicted Zn-ribbon and HTH transcriptional regulator
MSTATGRRATQSISRPDQVEVADIFRIHGQRYRDNHRLPLSHLKVMRAIESCRTSALGGHVEKCDRCGLERISYNSCRNRHCPKCQSMAKAAWLQQRKAELLPVGYFHNVFTLPHELNPIALANKEVIFNLLFKSVAETLQEFASDPKHGLAGRLGFTAVLHTWNQKLSSHIHLHCVIPGGVLSWDNKRWVHARDNFLFHVKALSPVFQGKFIYFLKREFNSGRLIFPGKAAVFKTKQGFGILVKQLLKKKWVVYSKKPFAGPEKVLDYLGRYTHRVAISNHRIVSVKNSMVTFSYRDRNDNNKVKHLTIKAEQFIRRFLMHVLPKSYIRIRHFGFLANKCKKKNLACCRQALHYHPPSEPVEMTARAMMLYLTGEDLNRCPHCKIGTMLVSMQLPKTPPINFQPTPIDSS